MPRINTDTIRKRELDIPNLVFRVLYYLAIALVIFCMFLIGEDLYSAFTDPDHQYIGMYWWLSSRELLLIDTIFIECYLIIALVITQWLRVNYLLKFSIAVLVVFSLHIRGYYDWTWFIYEIYKAVK